MSGRSLWCQPSRRHVLLGRPLFLLPWGFQQRACLVTLDVGLQRVCPINLHPRLLIPSSGGTWLVSLQRSVLLMVTDQRIRWPESIYTNTVFTVWKVSRITIFKKLPLEKSSLFEFTIKDKRKNYQLLKKESKLAELEIGHSAISLKSTAWNFGKQIVTNPGGG